LGSVRFRGRISDDILDDVCMLKPPKTIVKTMVLKLFRLFEKVVKSTQKFIQNQLKNHQNI